MAPPLRRTQKPSFPFVGAGHWPARGRGTPQGGFSRPSADSPLALPLQDSRASSKFWAREPLGAPAVDDSGKKVTLIRLAYARHLPPWRGKARAADSRPYGGYRGYSLISQGPVPDRPAGGASPSPTNLKKAFQTWVGEPLGAPARIRTGSICSTKPGAVVEPHRRQFLNSQPPVGRREFR